MVGRQTTGRAELVNLLDGLPLQHYQCIHADIPWDFESWSAAGQGRSAQAHYNCLPDLMMARLPVLKHAAPHCHLFFWITGPMLAAARHVRIMRSWGFEPTAMAFVWVKLNPSWHPCWLTYVDDAMAWMGLGHTTRQNAEYCLLGRRGSPARLSKSVRQIILAPIREHSRKPEDVYDRIETYCRGPRLDLFGRRTRPGWEVRGDQVTMFD